MGQHEILKIFIDRPDKKMDFFDVKRICQKLGLPSDKRRINNSILKLVRFGFLNKDFRDNKTTKFIYSLKVK